MAKSAKSSSVVPPVIVIAGDETFLRNEHLAEIQRAIFDGAGDPGMGLVRLDAGALGPDAMATVLDEARTGSMFAPKKMVIVDPADPLLKKPEDEPPPEIIKGARIPLTNREMLENYVAAPAESATLVLVFTSWLKSTRLHKALDKQGAVRWCDSIKEFQAPGWILRRAKDAYNKTIDTAAAGRLAELIGPDLQRLDNELAKLSLYDVDAPAITQKTVDALVGFQHEQQIWDMINALSECNAAAALKKIDELWALEPKIEYTATGAVFSWLNQVIKARELIDRRIPDAMIGKELKIWPPDRAQKVLSLARRWGLPGAARWSEQMLRMDVSNKSGLGEARRNLEKFVVLLCES